MLSNGKTARTESALANLTADQIAGLRNRGLNDKQMEWVSEIGDPARREQAYRWITQKAVNALSAVCAAKSLPPMRNLSEDQVLMLVKGRTNSQDITFVDGILDDRKRGEVVGLIADGLKASEAIHQVLTIGSYHHWVTSGERAIARRIGQDERVEIEEIHRIAQSVKRDLRDMENAAERREILDLIKGGMDSKAAYWHVRERPQSANPAETNDADTAFSAFEQKVFDRQQVGKIDRGTVGAIKDAGQRREVVNLIALGATPHEAISRVLGGRPARLSDTILRDARIANALTEDQITDLEMRGFGRNVMERIAMLPKVDHRDFVVSMLVCGGVLVAIMAALEEYKKPPAERSADWRNILADEAFAKS